MAQLSDATWLLLWQIWREQQKQPDFHSTKALIHRVIELEMEMELGSEGQAVVAINPVLICICGQYKAQLVQAKHSFLMPGCYMCDTDAEEVSKYISWLHHVLEADYSVRISTDSIRRAIAIALSKHQ